MNLYKLRIYQVLFFIFYYSNSKGQLGLTSQSIEASYGRNYCLYKDTRYGSFSSLSGSFNSEYSLEFKNFIKVNAGFQVLNSIYEVEKTYTHTNRYYSAYSHSTFIAPILLLGLKLNAQPITFIPQIGFSYQLKLRNDSKRYLLQDNQLVFEEYSENINSSYRYIIYRLRLEYKIDDLIHVFFNTDYQHELVGYFDDFPVSFNMSYLTGQVGLRVNIIHNNNE